MLAKLTPLLFTVLLALTCAGASHSDTQGSQHRKLNILANTLDRPTRSVPNDGYTGSTQGENGDVPLTQAPFKRTAIGNEPEQVHIVYWDAGNYVISWATGEAGLDTRAASTSPPADSAASIVRYGKRSGQLTKTATGISTTYKQDYTGGALGNDSTYNSFVYSSPLLHHVLVEDLDPATTYYYSVGGPDAESKEYSFTTLGECGENNIPAKGFSIGVYGDIGGTYDSISTVQHIESLKHDLILNCGDFTYADDRNPDGSQGGKPKNFGATTYQPRWDGWGRFMEQLNAYYPFAAVNANHEIEQQPDGTTQASYSARYPVPQRKLRVTASDGRSKGGNKPAPINTSANNIYDPSRTTNNMYYSVDVPGAHIFFITPYITNDTYGPQTEQYQWLKQDLESVDRAKTPWVIGVMHAPWYLSNLGHFKEVECHRVGFEKLLYDNGVDLVFHGHTHSYERTYPMYNYTIDPCGPAYITIGDGGNVEKLYTTFIDSTTPATAPQCFQDPAAYYKQSAPKRCYSYQPQYDFFPQNLDAPWRGYCYSVQPDWSAYREPSFGSGRLVILDGDTATWEWHRNQDGAAVITDSTTYMRRDDNVCNNKRRRSL